MRTDDQLFELVQRRAAEMAGARRRRRRRLAAVGVPVLVAVGFALSAAGGDDGGERRTPLAVGPSSSLATDPGTGTTAATELPRIRTQPVDIAAPGRYVLTSEPISAALVAQLSDRRHGDDIAVGIGFPSEADRYIDAVPGAEAPRLVQLDAASFVIEVVIDVTEVRQPYLGFTAWLT